MTPQQTQNWLDSRIGRITASRFGDATDQRKDGAPSQKQLDYLDEKLCELLTGEACERFQTKEMRHGTEQEPLARSLYMDAVEEKVALTGLVLSEESPACGGSPDLLVGDDGLAEFKCPYWARNHLATLKSQAVPAQYVAQVQGLMWVLGRKWCDFVSYHEKFSRWGKEMVVVRVERDDEYIAEMVSRLEDFQVRLQEQLRGILSEKDAEAALREVYERSEDSVAIAA